jgi:hypothetical protein
MSTPRQNPFSVPVLLCAGLLAAGARSPAGEEGKDPPPPTNVLLLLADDLGVEILSSYGAQLDQPPTPVLDQLALDGVRFTHAWASPLCTPTRAALQNILALKARVAAAQSRVSALDREVAEIGADQKRLRDNLEALTKTPEARQPIARYVQKADQQETRLEQLAQEKQAASQEWARVQAQLDAALRALALERDLAMKE